MDSSQESLCSFGSFSPDAPNHNGDSASVASSKKSSKADVILDLQKKYQTLLQDHIKVMEENGTLYAKCSELTIANKNLLGENNALEEKIAFYRTKVPFLLKKFHKMQKKIQDAEAAAEKNHLDDEDINEICSLFKLTLQSFAEAVIDEITATGNKPAAKNPKEKIKDNISVKIMCMADEQRDTLVTRIKQKREISNEE